MSIIMKSMKAGAVTINEFNSYIELLPVMTHIHDQHLPYYVIENGKTIFQGNLQYLEAQKQPVNSYTLKIKKADGVSVETFTDFTKLSAAACVANDAGLPWFIVDNNMNKVIRKGNCDNLQKPTPAPKAGVAPMPEPETPDIDIDAALDEMNDAVGDFDDAVIPEPVVTVTKQIDWERIDRTQKNYDTCNQIVAMASDAVCEQWNKHCETKSRFQIVEITGLSVKQFSDKESMLKEFNKMNADNVAMLVFEMPAINLLGESHVPVCVKSYNMDNTDFISAAKAVIYIYDFYACGYPSWGYNIKLDDKVRKQYEKFLNVKRSAEKAYFDCDRPHHVKLTGSFQVVYIENGEVKCKSSSNTDEDKEEFCKKLFVANVPYMIVSYGHYGQTSYEFHNDTSVRRNVELDSITPAARQAIESVLEEGPHENGGKQEFYWEITEKAGYYLLMIDEGEDSFENEVVHYHIVGHDGSMF